MEKYDVIILGGGAAGMAAAITAAKLGSQTALLEHMPRVGKKILSTGNGKCNITNTNLDSSFYRSEDEGFVSCVLNEFSHKDTLDFFEKIGIMTYEKDGYVYPMSNQASSVLDALRFAMEEESVCVYEDIFVSSMENKSGTWVLNTKKTNFSADKIIFALGGLSAPKTGSDGCGYFLIKSLGHKINKPLPALCPLVCEESFYKSISGVRTDAKIKLFSNDKLLSSDIGQLQLTNYGISGIPVFQVSRFASYALSRNEKVYAEIDFAPLYSEDELKEALENIMKNNPKRRMKDALNGIFNKKLAELFLKLTKIDVNALAETVSGEKTDKLYKIIKSFRTNIISTGDFEAAQVTAGGVSISEINPKSMESKLHKGIYFAGEMIDVDGKCGGYNLQWAWATGNIAARAASGGNNA
ncbi:MAG: NAD(P)/FAD-dependent oxidoreductase [Eubacterium sp.]|nr:NAD(P)/FAD-dependent oxidoreductase [Eubacterium sp.]